MKYAMHEPCDYTTLGWGYNYRSQPEDFFLFFPRFTGVTDVGGGLACICGASTSPLSLRSTKGADARPLTFTGNGEAATPFGRDDRPFIPFERVCEGALQEPAASRRPFQRLVDQRHGARTNL